MQCYLTIVSYDLTKYVFIFVVFLNQELIFLRERHSHMCSFRLTYVQCSKFEFSDSNVLMLALILE
jgi:hypothetical protein